MYIDIFQDNYYLTETKTHYYASLVHRPTYYAQVMQSI